MVHCRSVDGGGGGGGGGCELGEGEADHIGGNSLTSW